MSESEAQSIRLRRATAEDEYQLLVWRNEEEARQASFHPDRISPEEHHHWFLQKLNTSDCLLYILDYQGEAIGSIRFDIDADNTAEVSISLERRVRGKGLSEPATRLACARLFDERTVHSIIARIKAGNARSMRLFVAAGFVKAANEWRCGYEAVIYRLARPED